MAGGEDQAAGHGHRRPHPSTEQMEGTFLQFDLGAEIERMRREEGSKAGQNAKTLVKYDDFRLVLITLDRGAHIPWHHTAARISIQAITGHFRVGTDDRTFDMPTGSILALDRTQPHEIEALEPSALLLTIAWGEEAMETREALGGRA
jgi:quercetin dioxygenase-like cupin family protein